MKKFILILLTLCTATACANTNKNENVDTDTIITSVVNHQSSEILFDFGNIDTIVYNFDDDNQYIKYSDSDVFDYESLAYFTGRDHWYGDYVHIDVDDEILVDFVYNYMNYKTTDDYWRKQGLNNMYRIVEDTITFNDGTVDIIYHIIQK